MKRIAFFLIIVFAASLAPLDARVAPEPAREFRAAWITPVQGYDWPRPGAGEAAQKAELTRLLDLAKAAHLNAVILHVRTSADALYPTKRAPWSAYLTGTQGKSPGYDPLAFALREAHARGLELHAWFNPFRATEAPRKTKLAASHITRRHPGWIVRYGSETWINPGIPAARAAVLATIFEVVERYDIDGVHLDDYFYPYREDGAGEFNDPRSWKKYGKAAGFKTAYDWRRDNVNKFIKALYAGVHQRKPYLAVGISPFGIWKSGVPTGVTGLDAYSEIYADARLWLQKGWLDYLAPQLYWPLDGVQSRFTRLDEWWLNQNVKRRYIWPGLGTLLAARWQPGEIRRQIDTVRQARSTTAAGHVHFHLTNVLAQGPLYSEFALVPAMPWLSRKVPSAVHVERRASVGDSIALRLTKPAGARWLLVESLDHGTWRSDLLFAKSQFRLRRAERIVVRWISRTGIAGPADVLRQPAH
ncbi:MAG TPA: family 10 glycosylhydrolase [Longimicrobiales bacterium]